MWVGCVSAEDTGNVLGFADVTGRTVPGSGFAVREYSPENYDVTTHILEVIPFRHPQADISMALWVPRQHRGLLFNLPRFTTDIPHEVRRIATPTLANPAAEVYQTTLSTLPFRRSRQTYLASELPEVAVGATRRAGALPPMAETVEPTEVPETTLSRWLRDRITGEVSDDRARPEPTPEAGQGAPTGPKLRPRRKLDI